jgi:hypothetical protein
MNTSVSSLKIKNQQLRVKPPGTDLLKVEVAIRKSRHLFADNQLSMQECGACFGDALTLTVR